MTDLLITEAAHQLGVHPATVRRRILSGQLQARKDEQDRWVVSLEAVAAVVNRMRTRRMDDLDAEEHDPGLGDGLRHSHHQAVFEELNEELADLRIKLAAATAERDTLLALVERVDPAILHYRQTIADLIGKLPGGSPD